MWKELKKGKDLQMSQSNQIKEIAEKSSIEEILKQVEETIGNLEAEDISLEDSFSEYKKGMELLKVCSEKIDAIEKKVLVLNGEGELDEFQ